MVLLDIKPEIKLSVNNGGRSCAGCPRCKEHGNLHPIKMQNGVHRFQHKEHGNLHPVCRLCGHCVLRGSHNDDTSDLEDK